MEQMTTLCDLVGQAIQKKEEEKRIAEEQAAKDRYWKIPICYDDDEDDTIIITPVLPIEEPVNSLSMGDKHLDTIPETESDEFIKSSVEDLVPIPSESEGIPDKMCDVPLCENTTPLNALNEHSEIVVNSDDDNSSSDDEFSPYDEDIIMSNAYTSRYDTLREKLLNVNLLIAKIDALRDNPTPSSDVVIKSTSTFSNLFLEETNTFDNSIPESETFRFNIEEISSGSSTTRSDLSLLDYKAFYFPPADRSDLYHEEFADELTHIMSPPNLECFKFKIEPDPGNLTSINPGIRKNVSTTNMNVPLEDNQSSLCAYVVWIYGSFLIFSRIEYRQKDEKQSQIGQNRARIRKELKNFAQILDIPCEGTCVFTDKWLLNKLAYGVPTDGPYQTKPPSPDDIILSIRINREGQVSRILHKEEIDVHEYQILTREILTTLKPLEEIIRENIFCLGGNWHHVPACLCYMLYCVVHSEKFNLAYFMAKRMEWVTKQKRLILPYGMLLTRLFKFIINENCELYNESYVLYDRVMNPLTAQQERKTRKDLGTRRGHHSTSSSSTFDQPSSFHLNDDDDGNDVGTSRASTPSAIRYVNSLTNDVPQVFQIPPNIEPHLEPFYTRQTEIINRQVHIQDEHHGGLRSIGKGLKNLWRNMKK
ncbi:hypothetical protein Tco_0575344 [Tanacetum coccineum]